MEPLPLLCFRERARKITIRHPTERLSDISGRLQIHLSTIAVPLRRRSAKTGRRLSAGAGAGRGRSPGDGEDERRAMVPGLGAEAVGSGNGDRAADQGPERRIGRPAGGIAGIEAQMDLRDGWRLRLSSPAALTQAGRSRVRI